MKKILKQSPDLVDNMNFSTVNVSNDILIHLSSDTTTSERYSITLNIICD
jgi:hypothetical protein